MYLQIDGFRFYPRLFPQSLEWSARVAFEWNGICDLIGRIRVWAEVPIGRRSIADTASASDAKIRSAVRSVLESAETIDPEGIEETSLHFRFRHASFSIANKYEMKAICIQRGKGEGSADHFRLYVRLIIFCLLYQSPRVEKRWQSFMIIKNGLVVFIASIKWRE